MSAYINIHDIRSVTTTPLQEHGSIVLKIHATGGDIVNLFLPDATRTQAEQAAALLNGALAAVQVSADTEDLQ
ncbi:hypothetical protein [Paracoccus shanxieyensis]|uniref:Uncharacterized protein n=1 Tax=Paracoccus shanxieyensis TaxID=2675752 RepID=A0A6L6J3G8_9RHOB|nr:hypothetical protein [Paracoccus shanxieyensis]MTH66729.1 hypothetical protein [Paracoccus shanxieyensis]MTH89964.1 hypothetical protein [Paracoccus shanxieyensis]